MIDLDPNLPEGYRQPKLDREDFAYGRELARLIGRAAKAASKARDAKDREEEKAVQRLFLLEERLRVLPPLIDVAANELHRARRAKRRFVYDVAKIEAERLAKREAEQARWDNWQKEQRVATALYRKEEAVRLAEERRLRAETRAKLKLYQREEMHRPQGDVCGFQIEKKLEVEKTPDGIRPVVVWTVIPLRGLL